jgi:hypothetical protein
LATPDHPASSIENPGQLIEFSKGSAMTEPAKTSTREKIAIVVSAAIVVSSIIYWIIQIAGVMEELKKAYG